MLYESLCMSIVQPAQEIVENEVKSWSLVALNRLFSRFESRGLEPAVIVDFQIS